jgi:hypothetical protein
VVGKTDLVAKEDYKMSQAQSLFNQIFTDKPMEGDKVCVRSSISDYAIGHDGYISHVVNLAVDNLLGFLKPYLNKGIYIHPLQFMEFDDYPSFERVFDVSARVSVVKQVPVIYKFVDDLRMIPTDVHRCDFCGGHTKNDMRGHCAACGAPRGAGQYDPR